MIQKGLRETPEDTRDFPLGALITLPNLSDLPERFALDALDVKDQGATDFCTAFASCTVSELQEGVLLSPEYSFAVSKMLSRDPEEWGQDIRKALKAHTKVGAIEQKDAPFSLENKTPEFLREFSNWPGHLLPLAGFHKKKTYWKITGPYDHYDNIRAALYFFRNEKRGVVSGVVWQWPVETFFLEGTGDNGFGHCIAYLGWDRLPKNEGLVMQNSAGPEAGITGRHLVSRETVNKFVDKFGAYMLIDLSSEEAEWHLNNEVKLHDNWLVGFVKIILSFLKKIKIKA